MDEIKIGITGQAGFIGYHLYNFLKLQENVVCVSFDDHFFDEGPLLQNFVSQCSVIVHLAGVNRHESAEFIYNRNVELSELLIKACEDTGTKPHILFASSTQEKKDNNYGNAKKTARENFIKWAEKNNAPFTGMVIPNVFGPFCNPFYNSVVATFCHQVMNNETPTINVDAEMELIYVAQLVSEIYNLIINKTLKAEYYFQPTGKINVSGLLNKLQSFKDLYINNLQIPELKGSFDTALFNTFRSYRNLQEYPVYLVKHTDDRGSLAEVVKELTGGQMFFSTTKPGITRGNHFHLNKIERFCVIKGEAIIRLRKIGDTQIFEYKVNGGNPSIIDMPVLYTHNITNTGTEELLTLFWSNEIFDNNNPDTYFETV